MSAADSYFQGVSANAASAFSNWRRWCHVGKSVVPRNFYREVDCFDDRPPPLVAWAEAVESIYSRELCSNRNRALVIAHEIFGGKPGTHRRLGVNRRQVCEWLASFGVEVDLIDPLVVTPSKIPPARLITLPESAHEFGMALPKPKMPNWARGFPEESRYLTRHRTLDNLGKVAA